MTAIKRFRSNWGVLPGDNLETWKKWFPNLKNQGYDGVEVVIYGLEPENLVDLRSFCDELGLEISVTIFTSWQRYIGPRPTGLVPDIHLATYREQLQLASILRPVRINAQSGADYWTRDEAVYFYQNTLPIDQELGLQGVVCHETHRNRGLFNPYVADYVLQRVPQLRITGDFSHWVVVCERLLDVGEEDQEILRRVIPHVHHIHTRIGTTQSSQCPEPTNPVFTAEREFFEKLWLRIIEHRKSENKEAVITFVPEYGPFPYHPHGSIKSNGEIADSEGVRLLELFTQAILQ